MEIAIHVFHCLIDIPWVIGYIFPTISKETHLTRKQQLLSQNARFYVAFETSDLNALESVWSHDADVRCVHPGWHLLEGWDAVRESWENIFQSESNLKVSLRNVSATIHGKLGCSPGKLGEHFPIRK
jgi:hypothetical protein